MLKGILSPARDKSISHRALMLGSIAKGKTIIHNICMGEDCLSTMHIFKKLGIHIELNNNIVTVYGNGMKGLSSNNEYLNCNNSGTSIRLISGILVAQKFESTLVGDASLSKRPMKRIIEPLSSMGADISSLTENNTPPLIIKPSHLHSYNHTLKISSAQVKSSILLAGMYADGVTTLSEPYLSRNHTEIMLKEFGADINTSKDKIRIAKTDLLLNNEIFIPCDISSAAFFIIAALIIPNSDIVLKDVGINPTRTGILEVCKNADANISIDNLKNINGELRADIHVRYTKNLQVFTIKKALIPSLIDELPILALLATKTNAECIIEDIAELRHKECDRALAIKNALEKLGGNVNIEENKMIISPIKNFNDAFIETYNDHRIAMTFKIASLLNNNIKISEEKSIDISYPNFNEDLKSLLI